MREFKLKGAKNYKEKMPKEHTLLAVFSLPSDVFHPGSSSVACCMVFELGVRYSYAHKTFFGYYKDDVFQKRKKIGRVEKAEGSWAETEKEWLNLYRNKIEKDEIPVLKTINANDEWLAEAYMKTNYSSISIKNFEKTVREYASFVVKLGKANLSNTAPKMQKINKNLNISNWKYFKSGTLFKIESTKGDNTNNLIEGGDVAYIAAKKESNGYEFMWSLNDNKEYISRGNCIIHTT